MSNSIDVSKCTGCGTCFKTCGLDVFRLDTEQPVLSPSKAKCPAGTVHHYRKRAPQQCFSALLGGLLRMKWDKLLPKGRSCPW
ncbi:4Fe-4S binding protein [Bilophila wadsworthia]|uniref:4Fe-4S binding protein n=1 Tax=Bilophila wadsworthia TaxID=35833 RepID=UPI00242CF478|nr:4Fe-4S binding protein [Bilophila wadsworthia]